MRSSIFAFLPSMILSTVSARPVWVAQERFENGNCSGSPSAVSLTTFNSCTPSDQCTKIEVNNITHYMHHHCDVIDRFSYAEKAFGAFEYVVVEAYATAGCKDLGLTTIMPATGSCADSTMYGRFSMTSVLYANGSALISLYNDARCEGDVHINFDLDSADIARGDCVQDYYKFYTSTSGGLLRGKESSSDTDSRSAPHDSISHPSVTWLAIVSIGFAAGALGFLTAVFIWKRRTVNDEQRKGGSNSSITGCDSYASLNNMPKSTFFSIGTRSSYLKDSSEQSNISYFWDDDKIAAARVDRDKIDFGQVISHGGYGQVMSGWFNGQHVAVKMLIPEYRKSMVHLTSFLEEVKLMTMLEHPRIVKFIGVAWDSLADLCLLTEYMEGGDLRALLSSYEAQKAPVGFNEEKAMIALHIAHALTYLHSLDPPVLHRDLKSKNILLSTNFDARLTDFGDSRVRDEPTMTAGVGTSLWMAPEVMMGEEYDEKADVFSMGVVLSELDCHTLPYSNAVEVNNPNCKISSAAIAHLVAMGKLRVEFSNVGSSLMVELGLACVAMNPHDRPTAAEALYKLHTILTTEFDRGTWNEEM